MGAPQKLSPEITSFIVDYSKNNPDFGCRRIAGSVKAKFQKNISKSSINAIIKTAGLSAKIGRRPSKKQLPKIMPTKTQEPLPQEIKPLEIIPPEHKIAPEVKQPEIEVPPIVLEPIKPIEIPVKPIEISIAPIPIPVEIKQEEAPKPIHASLKEPYFLTAAELALSDGGSIETAYFEMIISDGDKLYIDAQMRSIWPTNNIFKEFAISKNIATSYINKFIDRSSPLIFFKAPVSLHYFSKIQDTKEIVVYSEDSKQIGKINVPSLSGKGIVFAIWPKDLGRGVSIGQEGKFEKIEIGHFKEVYFYEINVQYNKYVVDNRYRAIAIKNNDQGKVLLNIYTNIPKEEAAAEKIVRMYLGQWPDPQSSQNDFNQKIELFGFGLGRDLHALKARSQDPLQIYCLRHFFPLGYEKLGLSTLKERFYDLKAQVSQDSQYLIVKFSLANDYPFLLDLHYAIDRVNEQSIFTPEGLRLFFKL